MNNIREYVAKAVAFKRKFVELEQTKDERQLSDFEELKLKIGSYRIAFPEYEDMVVSKALFDMRFVDEPKIRKFIDNQINDLNNFIPQNISRTIDIYMQSAAWIVDEIQKEKKWYNLYAQQNGLLRFNELVKNGKTIAESQGNKNTSNPNILDTNAQDPNRVVQKTSTDESSKKGVRTVAKLSHLELENAKKENNQLMAQKKAAQKAADDAEKERLKEYTLEVQRRRMADEAKAKQAYQEMQNALRKTDS